MISIGGLSERSDASIFSALVSRADHAVAAIDWCEENYAVTSRIAEWWNTISSFLFVIVGVHAAYRAIKLRLPAVHGLSAVFIAATGLASAWYHATLLLWGQRTDEVFENAALAALLHATRVPPASPLILAGHVAVATAGILLVSAFLFTELHLIGTALLLTLQLSRVSLPSASSTASPGLGAAFAKRIRFASGAALLGALAWLTDRVACSYLSSLPFNPQGHAWWHVCGAVALHEAAAAAAVLHCVCVSNAQVRIRTVGLGLLTVVEGVGKRE